jgi:sugar lactone lactonase YvrE
MIFVDKPWQQIGGNYGSISSLTSDREGNVYFADPNAGNIERVDANGKITQFAEPPNDTSILRMGANDRIYTYSPSTGEIVSSDTATGTASDQKTIDSNLAAVVDFVVTETGTIYFLDGTAATIGVIDSSGQPRVALRWTDLGGEMTAPKGLALSPDQSMLVVTDTVSRYSWSFQIAADGTLENGEPFYRLELPETTAMSWQSGTRGAVEDVSGMVYFATPLGTQICMQNGRVVEILNPPVPGAPITAIAFAGGNDTSLLCVAENGKLYRRPVKVTGANAWTVVKPPKPTL